uniref:VASt domain-containing protein n=1 Tax=Peronospora matthiolae TaxID=2874970 RepID=A0AAV1UKT0_9STRA
MSSSSQSSSRHSDEFPSSMASVKSRPQRLTLPLDHDFLPLPKEDEEKEQERVRDQVICMIFDLPESTQFYKDFSCAIASTLAMHGRMYPTSSHVCFYSNVFGRERKILIPYESIRELEKTTTMVFQHAIRLATSDKDEYTFTSFWGNNRDTCYAVIAKARDRVLRELCSSAVGEEELQDPILSPSSGCRELLSPLSSSATESGCDEDGAEEVKSDVDAVSSNGISKADANESVITMATWNKDDEDKHVISATPRRRSVVLDMGSIAPKDVSMTQVFDEVFPVSVDTFMQTFYLDNAPFGLDKFSERIGSTEMTVNPWIIPAEGGKSFGVTRSLHFRVPIDAPIGPKSSHVDVLQCMKEKEHGVRVVESSTRLVDIPYGDYFSVEDRWTIAPHPTEVDFCRVYIELKVVFGKSTFWKKTIEARAISDNQIKWEKWVGMAKEFLNSRNRDDAVNRALKSSLTSGTSLDKAVPQEDITKDCGVAVKHRGQSKLHHRHHGITGTTLTCGRVCTAAAKVFPWILVLVLLTMILRLHTTFSNVEQSLLENTRLIVDLQKQLASLQAGTCPMAA